jgi:hypothetical protein
MNALVLAKHRARARHRQGGAAMFIVAMTISVLASVGIYALAAASSEVRTSGNERQNTQTHYLAEYGIIGVADQITTTRAQWYLGLMLSQPDTPCLALPGILPTNTPTPPPMSLACRRLGAQELGQAWQTYPNNIVPYAGTTAFDPTKNPGSLGPIPMSGDFFVELTDPAQANPPPRYALNLNFCFIGLTASSNGVTQPLYAGATDPTKARFAGEGLEVQRARIIVGPIQCPK